MKKKEQLKSIIRDFHESALFDVKTRNVSPPTDSKKIITLIGVRRCGKTSIFFDMINTLSTSVDRTKILYLNFEDERLELVIDELDMILQAYRELYPSNDLNECYFFFDEIQNILGWEKFIRRIYDTLTKNLFITGSNSKMLSTDIATALRGRTISYEVYPLSFSEYLRFKEIRVDFYSSTQRAYIQNALTTYLREGGFPETLMLDKHLAMKTLQEYFNVLLYKDIAERYAISNTVALKFFIKRLFASSTKAISINKIYNELKSHGIKIGKNTLYDFLDYVQNTYLVLTLQKYDNSLVNKELGERKIYSIDMGLNNATTYKFSDDFGKALENSLFLELKRRGLELSYYSSAKSECDFVLFDRGHSIQAIQVAYDMDDAQTYKREIKGLVEACKFFNLCEGTIVTFDTTDVLIIDEISIKIIPFAQFVLNEQPSKKLSLSSHTPH